LVDRFPAAALGAILYHVLTGRAPYAVGEARSQTVRDWRLALGKAYEKPPAPLREFVPRASADLQAICDKCLDKAPERRYSSALELADDLRSFLDNRPTRARPLGGVKRSAKWVARHPALASLLLAAMIVIGVFLGTMIQHDLEVTAFRKELENKEQTIDKATWNWQRAKRTWKLKNLPPSDPIK
jgi:serine/threonine protein kinase